MIDERRAIDYLDSADAPLPTRLRQVLAFERLATWAAAAVGLGIAIALASGDMRIERSAAVAVAALVAATLVRRSFDRVPWDVALVALLPAAAAGIADGLLGHPANAGVFASLVYGFVALGASLGRDLAAAPAAGLGRVEMGGLPELNLVAVASELNRARRYNRPLSVLNIDLSLVGESFLGRRRIIADLARSLSLCLRQSDVLGYQGRGRVVVVLPETRGEDADLLVERVRDILEPAHAAALRIGRASFPDEELTWVGLEGLALERARSIEIVSVREPSRSGDDSAGGTLVPDVYDSEPDARRASA